MKPIKHILMTAAFVLALFVAVPVEFVHAATCSAGANCRACKNCSACGHCAKRGGTCSVCRPDLYKKTSAPIPTVPKLPSSPTYTQPAPSYPSSPSAKEPSWVRMQRLERELLKQQQKQKQRKQQKQPRRPSSTVVSKTLQGKCVAVADGDTITILINNRQMRVRLYGIDCPEKAQAYGTKAKQFTGSLVFGKTATVYSKGTDRYGRTLGWVFVGKTCVNTELVRNGYAWWYRQYSPKETKLAALETEAKKARRGLWADPNPIPPWDFRNTARRVGASG